MNFEKEAIDDVANAVWRLSARGNIWPRVSDDPVVLKPGPYMIRVCVIGPGGYTLLDKYIPLKVEICNPEPYVFAKVDWERGEGSMP